MTDDPQADTRAGRIIEAVLISFLTTAATKLVEDVAERIQKRRRSKRKKPAATKPP